MANKQQIDPVEMMINAKRYLSEGRFFLALDVASQVENYINQMPQDDFSQRLRKILRPILREAWRQTAEAVEEILPRRKIA